MQKNYQDMEDGDNGEGEEGVEAAAEELRAPGEDDDGVVRDGNDGGDQEDHEVAQGLEAGAEPERVYLHPGVLDSADPNLGDDCSSGSSRRE